MTAGRQPHVDPDARHGAIEGDRPEHEQQGNAHAPGLDRNGLPNDPTAVAEDRIGANIDDSEVANADEAGRSSDALREELDPLK